MLLYLVIPIGFLVTATNGVLFGCLSKPCQHVCVNVFFSILGYECRCHSGYSKDPSNSRNCIPNRPSCGSGFRGSFSPPYECVDIDECNEETSPCQQVCRNSQGSYECSCRSGYVISSRDPTKCERPVDKNCQKGFQPNPRNPASCIDIDECAEKPSPCQHLCENSKGSYECKCRDGFQINEADPNRCDIINTCRKGFRPNPENPKECLDINECAKNPPCEQLCDNSQGSYECKCRPGFRTNEKDPARCDIVDNCQAGLRPNLTNPTQCLDVDECAEGTPCEQICTNTKGSFVCSCRDGFRVKADDAAKCEETDKCRSKPCQQICSNTNTGFQCSCRPGYAVRKSDPTKCDDVDECVANNPCEHVCQNKDGGFACSCREGFKVSATNSDKCEAIDKCRNEPCEQICTSTDSGYQCSCRRGYAVRASDPSKCDDVDECSRNNPCEQVCTNTAGSYTCSCRSGFKVSATDKTKCESEDRCSNNPCEQNCTSTSSGFECSCKKGYVVSKSDPTKCDDVDECLGEVNPCDHTCINVRGNFRCSCREGFVVDPGNKRKCIEDSGACQQGRQCEQICTVIPGGRRCSCRPGYVISEEDNFLCDESEVCTAKADIVLVFDASNSIGVENFHKQFDFAKRLAAHFKIGPNDVRFGGVLFSRYAEVLFNLKDNDNIEGVNNALTNIKYMNSSTYTHEALKLITSDQLFSSAKGGRANAKDVVVVFTDGDPVSLTKALAEAQVLKDKGALIIAVGIGKEIKMTFLQQVSSTPEDALEATSYDTLEYIEKRLTKLLCEAAATSS